MVTISDGLPFQWYLNGELSFNTKVNAFTEEVCFHQEFKCTSNVINRIIDDEDNDYVLRAYKNGVQFGGNIPFTKTPIVDEGVTQPDNNEFAGTIAPWTTDTVIFGGTQEWAWSAFGGGSAQVGLGDTGGDHKSMDLKIPYAMSANRTYRFAIRGQSALFAPDVKIKIYGRNSISTNSFASNEENVGSEFDEEFTVTPTEDCDELIVIADNGFFIGADPTTVSLYEIELLDITYGGIHEAAFTPQVQGFCDQQLSFKIHRDSDDSVIAYTDEIIFNEETSWSLIKYKRANTFAGIFYDENSPLFEIYFPFQFSRNRQVAQTKTTKLSNGQEFNTASEITTNRRLLLAPMADFMHKKLQIVLQHATKGVVEIDGKEWTWKESYEYIDPPAEEGPLQQANVYLTDKNDGTRNVL